MTLRKILLNNCRTILFVLLFSLPKLVWTAEFKQVISREGADIGLTQIPASQTWNPNPFIITDQFFGIIPPTSTIDDIYITGKLKINDRLRISHTMNWGITLTYDIELYDETDALVLTINGETLSVTYMLENAYLDFSQNIYRNGANYHKAVISITMIYASILNDDGSVSWSTTAPTSLNMPHCADISMEWECTSVRSMELRDVDAVTHIFISDGTVDSSPVCSTDVPENIIRIGWAYALGAENYDVEWLFLDIPDASNGNITQDLDFDWRDATRINTPNNFYDVPLLYPKGIIVYRVRSIGVDIYNGNARLEGRWTIEPGGYMDNLQNLSDDRFVFCGMEMGLNWTTSLSFAEEGKRKGVVSFVDGTGRTRQTITTLSTDENTIVVETSLDHMGRPAVNFLPVPVRNEQFKYFPAFNTGFGADDYDTDAAYANSPVQGVPGSTAVSDFYSADNPFITLSGTPYEKYLANLTKYTAQSEFYPFTQTRMMNDGSGRPRSTSGVGETHALNNDHETQYFYGTPGSQQEIDRLFGSEAGFVSYYKKNIIVDPNGQASITYLDGYGRTVATALAGTNTSKLLEPLENSSDVQEFTADLLQNNAILSDQTLVSTKDIVVATPAEYSFSYDISTAQYEDLCAGTHDCIYEFFISIKNEDGVEEINPAPTWEAVDGTTFPYTFHVTLNPGKYTITKILRIKEDELTSLISTIDTELLTWETTSNECFIPPFVSACFSCEQLCEQAYKYPITYNNNTYWIYRNLSPNGGLDFTTDAGVAGAIVDENENPIYELALITDPNITDAEAAITSCQEQCGVTPTVNMGTECEMKRILLLRDVLPDGQYFENRPKDPEFSGTTNANYLTGSESNPDNRNAWLEAYASDLKDDFGALLNPAIGSPTWEEIRENWYSIDQNDPAFGSLKDELIQRHPEYCMWKAHCENSNATCLCMEQEPYHGTPNDFASLMANINTDQEAFDAFLFTPAGYPPPVTGYYSTFPNITQYFNEAGIEQIGTECYADPILYCFADTKEAMHEKLSSHMTVTVGSMSVPISVWYLIDDPEDLRLHDLTISSHPDYPDAFVEYMQLLHGSPSNPTGGMLAPFNTPPTGNQISRWQFFSSVYTFHRMQLVHQMAILEAEQCMDCEGSPTVENPLCEDIASCSTGVACNRLPFLSAWDYDDDGYVDMGIGENSFSFSGMEIRYPYIALLDGPPTGPNLQADHCETNCSALATQWINQLQYGIRACSYIETSPNATPPLNIPETDKQILRAYFTNICMHACEGQANGFSYTHDYTSFPLIASDWTDPEYVWGDSYGGTNIIQSVNDVVTLYLEQYGGAVMCPVIVNSIPVGGAPAPNVNDLNCACDNLAYFLTSNPGLLQSDYENINPLMWELFSVSATTIFDFTEIETALSVIDDPYWQDLNGAGINIEDLILHWLTSCTGNTIIPPFINSPDTLYLPDFIDCSNNTDTIPAGLNCGELETEQEQNVNSAAFATFKQNLLGDFETGYRHKCIAAAKDMEVFSMTYETNEYHYTLYYYDQAGNLVKTVPPAGVSLITNPTTLADIHTFRVAHHHDEDYQDQNDFYWPEHKKITSYVYNAQNQVIQQTTPDAGTQTFYYDALGRLVYSQNAQQEYSNHFSYTLYDPIGRIIEVGETQNVTGAGTRPTIQKFVQTLPSNIGDPTPFENAIETYKTSKRQIVVTKYDRSYMDDFGFTSSPFKQENLRNRVSSTLYYEQYPAGDNFELYDNASHYSYDIHGNVRAYAQDVPALQAAERRFLLTEYKYDLISGKVNEVHYMKGFKEQFSHYYRYDADNRITATHTSKNGGIIKELEAKYFYYPTGALARVELGRNQVQGIDYAYTIHGWLKGMNSDVTNTYHDIGKDAFYDDQHLHSMFGMDAAGFSLAYYSGDYSSVGSINRFDSEINNTDDIAIAMHPSTSSLPNWGLYNGNIVGMTTASLDCDENLLESLGRGFKYDQLNRIRTSTNFLKDYTGDLQAGASPTWYSWGAAGKWDAYYRYDPDGNLTSLERYGDVGIMDQMYYDYVIEPNNGSNKLNRINDAFGAYDANYTIDIDHQSDDNYLYDLNGNLIYDRAGNIDNINWNVYGKVRYVINATASASLWFGYNPAGNRIIKFYGGSSPYYTSTATPITTFYALDAQGNTMAVYEYKENASTNNFELTCKEQIIYGNSRIGMLHRNEVICEECVDVVAVQNSIYDLIDAGSYSAPGIDTPKVYLEAWLGTREYEIANHLGNVLATIADRKLFKNSDILGGTIVFEYRPQVITSQDYYPFGMKLPGRSIGDCDNSYRFGFNSQEKDNEVYGDANAYDFEFRTYDSRLGRFLSVDPLYKKYPWNSPYSFAENDVIRCIDIEGAEKIEAVVVSFLNLGESKLKLPIIISMKYDFNTENVRVVVTTGDHTTGPISVIMDYKKGQSQFGVSDLPLDPKFFTEKGGSKYSVFTLKLGRFIQGWDSDLVAALAQNPEVMQLLGVKDNDDARKLLDKFMGEIEGGNIEIWNMGKQPNEFKIVEDEDGNQRTKEYESGSTKRIKTTGQTNYDLGDGGSLKIEKIVVDYTDQKEVEK